MHWFYDQGPRVYLPQYLPNACCCAAYVYLGQYKYIRPPQCPQWLPENACRQNKQIAEDERFKSQDEVQKLIDKYTAQIDEALEAKEKEIKAGWESKQRKDVAIYDAMDIRWTVL